MHAPDVMLAVALAAEAQHLDDAAAICMSRKRYALSNALQNLAADLRREAYHLRHREDHQ